MYINSFDIYPSSTDNSALISYVDISNNNQINVVSVDYSVNAPTATSIYSQPVLSVNKSIKSSKIDVAFIEETEKGKSPRSVTVVANAYITDNIYLDLTYITKQIYTKNTVITTLTGNENPFPEVKYTKIVSPWIFVNTINPDELYVFNYNFSNKGGNVLTLNSFTQLFFNSYITNTIINDILIHETKNREINFYSLLVHNDINDNTNNSIRLVKIKKSNNNKCVTFLDESPNTGSVCSLTCSDSMNFDVTKLTCTQCQDSCTEKMKYSYSNVSTFCPLSYIEYNNNICTLDTSSTGTYIDPYDLSTKQCSASDEHYSILTETCSNGQCTGDIISSNNVCICNKKLLINETLPHTCVNSCPTNRIEQTIGQVNLCSICSNLPDIYYLNNVCVSDCGLDKYSDNNNVCVSCALPNIYLYKANSTCYSSCPDNPLTGKQVSGQSKYCSDCPNYKEVSSDTCVDSCGLQKGQNISNSKLCEYCPVGFKAQYNNCINTDCANNELEILDNVNNHRYCISGCSNNLVYENFECKANCTTVGYIAGDFNNNICGYCQNNQYLYNNACVASCDNSLGLIANDTHHICELCNEGTYLLNGVCVNNCNEIGLTTDEDNNVCLFVCAAGEYFLNSQCVNNCEEGTSVNNTYRRCDIICTDSNQYWYNNVCANTNCTDDGYQANNIYKRCDLLCSSPNYSFNNSCVPSCEVGTTTNDINRTCIIVCTNNGEYYFNNVCTNDCSELGLITNDTFKRCDFVCNNNNYLSDNNCVSSCPANQRINNTYKRCDYICSNNQFLFKENCVDSCSERGIQADTSINICNYICNEQEYLNTDNTCSNSCPIGTNINFDYRRCDIMCSETQYFFEDNCYSSCSDEVGLEIDITFNHKICKTICSNTQYYNSISKTCVLQCPINYLSNNTFNRCDKIDCSLTNQFIEDGKCVDDCSNDFYVKDTLNKTCILCNKVKSNYNNNCVDTCPTGYFIKYINNDSTKESKCDLCNNYLLKNTCILLCPALFTVVDQTDTKPYKECICNTNKYNLSSDGLICSCKEGQAYNEIDKSCQIISNNNSDNCLEQSKVNMNGECKDTCDENYFLDKNNHNTCVNKCPLFSKKGECIDVCPEYNTPNTNNECIPCIESNKKYILHKECVDNCPSNYTVKNDSINNLNNVCELLITTLSCDNYCKNNGICTQLSNLELECNCELTSFYGLQCNYSQEDTQKITEEMNNLVNNLESIDFSNDIISEDLVKEILNITETLLELPEINNEKLNEVIKAITEKQLDLVNNGQVEPSVLHFLLSDSSISLSNIK